MSIGTFHYPQPANEPVLNYAPGSPERAALKRTIAALKKQVIDVPMYIGGKAVRTGKKVYQKKQLGAEVFHSIWD